MHLPSGEARGDTIFALSSAPGRAAVAVIRISGPEAHAVLGRMVRRMPGPREAAFRRIFDPRSGAELDQALVVRFDAPATETGEDLVELQVHGSRAVVAAIYETLGGLGLRLADAGEFARRAFANGKLDLTAAEGLADLIDAETEWQRRQALTQAGGALAAIYEGWRGQLLEAMGLTEALIDFADEGDVAGDISARARQRAEALRIELAAHLTDGRRGEILRDGYRVVLAGPVNAGKSTLLNWLAKRDAAITSAEPGTTRDVIEVRLDLGGMPVFVSDTAGFRELGGVAGGVVEREGMRRSRAQVAAADLVLWLVPADAPETADGLDIPANAWVIQTKIDLVGGVRPGPRAISVETGAGLAELMAELVGTVAGQIGEVQEPRITQDRHRRHVAAALEHVEAFLAEDAATPELAAEALRLAATEIGRLTGRIGAEDVLGEIFGRFCIGK